MSLTLSLADLADRTLAPVVAVGPAESADYLVGEPELPESSEKTGVGFDLEMAVLPAPSRFGSATPLQLYSPLL